VDTSPDFREQALAYKLPRIDAVLFTHSHADHIFGFDDIRRFNTMQKAVIPAYGSKQTIADLKRIFDYVGTEEVEGLYRPRIEFMELEKKFTINGAEIEVLDVQHGDNTVQGFLFRDGSGSFAYVPDCSDMPDEVVDKLKCIDVMVLDALRYRPHKTHFTVERSVEFLRRIGAGQSYLIHMCHDLDHQETQDVLPEGISIAYDGLVLDW